ncbi:VOC family protein [Fodinicola feengrottensis]|uniref:VOC family protein n=2 Tax=Fodinicola feengrottensis TaxID=435914 RepID=A0ABN2I216_9ACTN
MTQNGELTRKQLSDAVTGLGWRLVLNCLETFVRAESLTEAVGTAAKVVAAVDGDERVQLAVDDSGVTVVVRPPAGQGGTEAEVELARRIAAAVPVGGAGPRSVQLLEVAIDALDIPAIMPFWAAVMGYEADGKEVFDPLGQGPTIWFQRMTEPRQQRNRIHFDISVPHDEADDRIAAALAAGGVLVSDDRAPAFWILADAEGNEVCVCTWQARD